MRGIWRTLVLAVASGFALTACDITSPGITMSPSATPPVTNTPLASQLPSVPPSSPGDLTWVSPTAAAVVDTYDAKLSVRTRATGIRRIEFKVAWASRSKIGCAASKPDAAGSWSCVVDFLELGVLPGPVTLRARVLDTAEHVIAGTSASVKITYGVVPPKPGNAQFKIVSQRRNSDDSTTETDRISWTSPRGYATEFRLYGVAACPNDSEAHDGEPCLVAHTPLAASSLSLIKTVKGSARSMEITEVTPPDACGPTLWCSDYYALVLGAFNEYGHSVYAIPFSTTVCFGCTY